MIYNEYELVYVANPELQTADLEKLSEKVQGLITECDGGRVLVSEDWGRRKMAYAIKNHEHGHYGYVNYVGGAGLPIEIERKLRIDDKMIRYMTVRLDENIDPDERQVLAEERMQSRAARREQELEAEAARAEARAARAAAHAEEDAARSAHRSNARAAETEAAAPAEAEEAAPAEAAPAEAEEAAPAEAEAEAEAAAPETEEETSAE